MLNAAKCAVFRPPLEAAWLIAAAAGAGGGGGSGRGAFATAGRGRGDGVAQATEKIRTEILLLLWVPKQRFVY
jgi:hypothetical protein